MNRSINNLYSQSKILSNLPHNKHDCWCSKDESKQKTDLGVNTHQVKMSYMDTIVSSCGPRFKDG